MQSICPHCNSPIHNGAEDQCPVCGYSMHRADAVFGAHEVEFTRVVDAAGALTHKERMELIRYLGDLERKLSPIALGVYITDHGQLSDFRHHAHWILNHARIHHPSFGKRQQTGDDDAPPIIELSAEERRLRAEEKEPGLVGRLLTRIKDRFRKCPPPVQQEWMLILVLDVQLEIACFSWGYMLDPYINPDTINIGIVNARLLFRERALVLALKSVMKKTVHQIATRAHKINRSLKKSQSGRNYPHAARLLTAAAGISLLAATGYSQAAPAVDSSAFNDDDYAEVVELPATEPTVEPQQPPAEAAPHQPVRPAPQPIAPVVTAPTGHGAATYAEAPQWSQADYDRLMQRQINGGFNMLIPGGQEITPTPLPKLSDNQGAFEESDTEVRGRYTEEYKPRTGRNVPDLNDPQKIMTDVERSDAQYALQALNAHSPYRICVSIFKAGQEVPHDLAASGLVHAIAKVDEYAVMIQYGMGDNATIDLGFKSINLSDEQRHAILAAAQQRMQAAGGGVEGLLAAMQCVKEQIDALHYNFEPLTAGTSHKLTQVLPEGFGKEAKEQEEPGTREKIFAMLANPAMYPFAIMGVLGIAGLIGGGFWFMRWLHSGILLETRPDYRLASRYGAGVSRHVRYLEGQEAAKTKTIF